MRQDKKWTLIRAPVKKMPEVKYYNCKIHNCRLVPVGEELRCPLCGSNVVEEEKEDTFKISGVI